MLFYLFAFIQRKIWNHIYMQAYVEPYLQRQQLRQEKRGIIFIENEHVRRISAYKNVILRKEFLKESAQAIDAKVKLWEKLTMNEGNHELKYKTEEELEMLSYEEDPDQQRRANCLKRLESRIVQKEILNYDQLATILKKNNFDAKKSYESILVERKKQEDEIRSNLYHITEIGLPPMRTSTSTVMYEGFKSHVIAAIAKVEEEENQKINIENMPEEGKTDEEEKLLDKQQTELDISPAYERKGREEHSALLTGTDQSYLQPQEEEDSIRTKILKSMQKKVHNAFPNTKKSQEELNMSFEYLLCYFIISSWTEITYAVLVLNFIIQPSILSFLLVVGVFCYAAVEYPIPSRKYWNFTIGYLIAVVFAKYVYQLPFFCGASLFSMRTYFGYNSTCPNEPVDPNSFTAKLSDDIGIYKFTESSFSVPLPGTINEGMAFGLLYDFITLIVLIIQCMILQQRGILKHVTLTNSKNYVPQFRKGDGSETSGARVNIFKRMLESCKNFVYNMLPYNVHLQEKDDYSYIKKPGADFYIPTTIFGTLITVFFLALFTAITGSGLSITESLDESSFSGGMVITVTVAVLILFLDRALYVSREDFTNKQYQRPNKLSFSSFFKYSFGLKVVLHYVLTITLLMFILVEYLNSNNNTSKTYLRLLCVLCGFFLYFSGSQVKWGYPLYHSNHSFRSPDPVIGAIYKGVKAIPFLFELGSILDWTFTKTALDLYQWMKLEDGWSYLYINNIENKARRDHRHGNPRGKWEKCYMGCLFVFAIMVILVGPLALFSSLNPNQQLNLVDSGSITVSIITGGENSTSSVFEIFNVENLDISAISKNEFKTLNTLFPTLEPKNQPQLQKITLNSYSDTTWDISPPNFNKLVQELNSSTIPFYINVEWDFQRSSSQGTGLETHGSNTIPVWGALRQNLINVLQSGGKTSFSIPNFFPKFLHLTNAAQTSLFGATELQSQNIPTMIDCYLEYDQESDVGYWMIKSYDESVASPDSNLFNNREEIVFYTFSEPVKGPIFGTNIGDLGVITIYATFVLAIGRAIRSLFDRISQRVIYDEMPETREIMELMENIYAARTEGNTYKEQKLYELLIRIYRSPEVIMQLTGRVQKYADPLPNKQPIQGEIILDKPE